MLRFQTAGESHGQGLLAVLSGLPAGLRVDFAYVDRELKRRQGGYGRGGRIKIESDRGQILLNRGPSTSRFHPRGPATPTSQGA